MTKSNKTEIIFLIDRSGSMASIALDPSLLVGISPVAAPAIPPGTTFVTTTTIVPPVHSATPPDSSQS